MNHAKELTRRINTAADIASAMGWVLSMVSKGVKAGPVMLSIGRPKRTLDQNALMWALLQDIALQVEWGGKKMHKDDWKEIFTAALRKQRMVPGIDGGFVVLGASTSKMSKAEMSELIELIEAFAADHDVKWSE